MIPEVIVFDLGKVLVDFDYGIAARKIAARGDLTSDEVLRIIDQSPLLVDYETGRLTKEEFFGAVCQTTGFGGDFEEFDRFFSDIFTPIEPMVELHARLRAQQTPTFILSNTNELAVGHIRRSFPFFDAFTGYAFSFEHGAMKPDAKLYEVVEQMSGASGAKILFLDDRWENVEAGRARGWQVIHHTSPAESLAMMEKLNVFGARKTEG